MLILIELVKNFGSLRKGKLNCLRIAIYVTDVLYWNLHRLNLAQYPGLTIFLIATNGSAPGEEADVCVPPALLLH
ncbi:hypothetical protein BUE76_09115 [Cnuella takakiae]|nr:hypothetical protein BUE76_09115 [Cnuella takakiae]